MPATSPGSGVPSVEDEARKSWWTFRALHPGSAADPLTSHLVAYRRGYLACLEASVAWSGLVEAVGRLNSLLEQLLLTEDATRIVSGEAEEEPNGTE